MIAETDIPVDRECFEAVLEGLVLLNMAIMRKVNVPPLYKSGVTYKNGKRRWDHVAAVLTRGTGDCKDLACWYAAELRLSGADPSARVCVVQTSPTMAHAFVVLSNGTIVDPAIDCGMPV